MYVRSSVLFIVGIWMVRKRAFEQAKGVMMLESPTEANTPMLYTKEGIDADMLFIVKPAVLDM